MDHLNSGTSTYPLRLPTSIKIEVGRVAESEGTSMNQFIAMAVAEKLSAMRTADFFKNHRDKANFAAFSKIMMRTGGEPPQLGDEII